MPIAFFEVNKDDENVLKKLLPDIEAIFVNDKLSLDNIDGIWKGRKK